MTKEYSKGREIVMFSEARIAFEKEIRDNHPKLAMKILIASKEAGINPGEFDTGIAVGTVAAEFNIGMEGYYEPSQIEFMYDKLWHKLRDSTSPLIGLSLPPGVTLN